MTYRFVVCLCPFMSTTGWTSSLRSTERVVDVDCFFGAWGPECHTASDAVECGTEHMPDRTPERLPDKMSEHMSDIMPEKMSERMAEQMPDRMPERMWDILGSAIAPCGLTRTHTHARTVATSFFAGRLWQLTLSPVKRRFSLVFPREIECQNICQKEGEIECPINWSG